MWISQIESTDELDGSNRIFVIESQSLGKHKNKLWAPNLHTYIHTHRHTRLYALARACTHAQVPWVNKLKNLGVAIGKSLLSLSLSSLFSSILQSFLPTYFSLSLFRYFELEDKRIGISLWLLEENTSDKPNDRGGYSQTLKWFESA